MDFKKLFETDGDERAVSPVIGVILMVAITVILAAVIGAFVIGIGDDQETVPQASWDWDYSETDDEITVTHSSGDSIDRDRLSVTGGGVTDTTPVEGDDLFDGVTTVSAGTQSEEIGVDPDDGAINLVWESEDGGTSSTLSSF